MTRGIFPRTPGAIKAPGVPGARSESTRPSPAIEQDGTTMTAGPHSRSAMRTNLYGSTSAVSRNADLVVA